jgi:hypothetical protein
MKPITTTCHPTSAMSNFITIIIPIWQLGETGVAALQSPAGI